jgi:hypothetical protein
MASHVLDSRTVSEAKTVLKGFAPATVLPGNPQTLGRVISLPVRRRIPPVSGHALEKLGHAIEYLTDEYIHEGCIGGFESHRLEAIQMLMAANREIYYECPIVPTLWQRIQRFFERSFDD